MNREEYYKRYHAGCIRTARTRQRCSGCPLPIQPGEQYLDSGMQDPNARHAKVTRHFCLICSKKQVL